MTSTLLIILTILIVGKVIFVTLVMGLWRIETMRKFQFRYPIGFTRVTDYDGLFTVSDADGTYIVIIVYDYDYFKARDQANRRYAQWRSKQKPT